MMIRFVIYAHGFNFFFALRKVSTCMNSTTLGSAFEIIPQDLNFGTLREGCTYSAKCSLRNIGIGTSRFTIKPPPTYTGIKVIYSPGEVSLSFTH